MKMKPKFALVFHGRFVRKRSTPGMPTRKVSNMKLRISPAAFLGPLLAVGMIALFTPLPRAEAPLIAWLSVALAFVYGAFSLATINHQAWGAELSGDPVERTRITAVREGLALFGVVIAAVLPAFLGGDDGGLGHFALLFAVFTLVCAAITVASTD